MIRKLSINVKTVKQFEAIKLAMAKPDVLAFVTVVGMLEPLASDEHKRFVLETVHKIFELQKDPS